MPRANYPNSVKHVIDMHARYKPEVLRAVKEFARSRPWRGTAHERLQKFREVNEYLGAAYKIVPPRLNFVKASAGNGAYFPSLHMIVLEGKLSVVTYLHEFAHAVFGPCEIKACKWSINLFRRCFPRSFARCSFDGHMIRNSNR